VSVWPSPTRPTRSWMFVPGNKDRFLIKASQSEADCVFLDLEDGVSVAHKSTARQMVARVLEGPWPGPIRFVRVNSIGSPWWKDDVEAAVRPGLDGVCLPKVERSDEIEMLDARLGRLEAERGLPAGSVRIVGAIESAKGLLSAPQIGGASARMVGLMFGAEDYALDLGLGTAREGEAGELSYHRSSLVVAAAAAGVLSIDGVFPSLEDPRGLVRDVAQARRLGFSGKSTFNPRQLKEINRMFTPSSEERAYAQRVVEAFEEAQQRGDASVAVGGQLVDLPIVMRARRVLDVDGPADGRP